MKKVINKDLFVAIEHHIYQKYQELKKDSGKKTEEYQKDLEFLFEMENDILNPFLDNRNDLEKFDSIISPIIERSNLSVSEKSSIINRLQFYFEDSYYRNPFLSNLYFSEEENQILDYFPTIYKKMILEKRQENENAYTISLQCDLDRYRRILYYLDQEIEKSSGPLKKELLKKKYDILYERKILERYLNKNIQEEELTDSSRPLIFHQNEKHVSQIYHNCFFYNIRPLIRDILVGDFYIQDDYDIADQIFNLIELQTAFDLISCKDLTKAAYDFYHFRNYDANPEFADSKPMETINQMISDELKQKVKKKNL